MAKVVKHVVHWSLLTIPQEDFLNKYIYCMTISPKRNAIFPYFMHHFEAHRLPFSVRFQHMRLEQHRLNTSLQEVKRNSGLNYLKFVVSVSEVLVVLVDRLLQNDFQHIHIAFLPVSIISDNFMQ